MSKFLYLIALILLSVWAFGVIAYSPGLKLELTLIAALIALLFGVMKEAIPIWRSLINNLLK